MNWKELREAERKNWYVDRASRSGIVRFSRIAGPTVLEDGTILPDFALEGVPEIRMQDGGPAEPRDVDSRGRMWIDFYAINPQEIVNHGAVGRIRFAWDSVQDSITEFMKHPAMLSGHNPDKPVGRWQSVEVNRDGTSLTGFISSAEGQPREWQGLMRDGTVEGSVGVDFVEADWNEKERLLDLRKVGLLEASLVGLPAMKSSFIRSVPVWAQNADRRQETPEPPGRTGARERPAPFDPSAALGAEAMLAAAVSRARVALARAGA